MLCGPNSLHRLRLRQLQLSGPRLSSALGRHHLDRAHSAAIDRRTIKEHSTGGDDRTTDTGTAPLTGRGSLMENGMKGNDMDSLIDDIARILASSMPRRRVLKLLGGALVAAIVGTVGSTRAGAQACSPACGPNQKCCTTGSPPFCVAQNRTCCGNTSCAANQACCGTGPAAFCRAQNQTCCGSTACNPAQTCCGNTCCGPNQRCVSGRCEASTA